ncbi:SCO2322 family protein [Streptomyces macrosporus]|uniref:SCO2322 family protein n=1 Tax=Streptomyces macrosporus TaxID=44032 RepID=A0ABP5X6X7_9ACTN
MTARRVRSALSAVLPTALSSVLPTVLSAACAAVVLVAAGAAPAHAGEYRYWSFWERDGREWTYATQGPGTLRPEDGAVLGFRFAVSEDSGDADAPRGRADFEAICGTTEPRSGEKRIALDVDFGTAADAPSGETPPKARTACAVVPEDGTAADALAAAFEPLRYDSSAILCAIAGYPRTGCGEQVSSDGAASDKATSDAATDEAGAADEGGTGDGGPSTGLLGGVALVAALGAAAVWQARRRRS